MMIYLSVCRDGNLQRGLITDSFSSYTADHSAVIHIIKVAVRLVFVEDVMKNSQLCKPIKVRPASIYY